MDMARPSSMHHRMLAALIILVTGAAGGYFFARSRAMHGEISPARCALRTDMRALWAEHVLWTRCFIISAVDDLADKQVATERLLKNQDDIGNAVAVYYGADAGKQLAKLLREHILIAADLVAAAKEGDRQKVKEVDDKWHVNAREIATFLSSANPHWPLQALVDMLNEHLALTTKEAVARIKKQWSEDIAAFDSVWAQALDMADHFTNGIVAQFPDKF